MTLNERIAEYAPEPPGKPSNKPRPTVITVRLEGELHQSLKRLAHEKHISLNGLCVASLEQAVEALDAPQPNEIEAR